HRFVHPMFRGPQNKSKESLGDIMLAACEQIVKSQANEEANERQSKTLEVDTGQLDVMLWLHKNGFEPKTAQDKERFPKVCNAAPDLCIVDHLFVWEKSKYRPDMDVFAEKEEAYHVTFVKEIAPASSEEMAAGVREQITREIRR
ncbi:MAG: hypothetical protein V1760_02010, partial [Candidatus Peregrinibacteria bacterium]